MRGGWTPPGTAFSSPFDAPARAVRCACAIRDAVRDIGIEIRAGLHTGEVERKGRSVTGLAVHVGAKVGAVAQASEVLVTSTVQMLVLGSGISFTDRGYIRSRAFPTSGSCSPWNTPDEIDRSVHFARREGPTASREASVPASSACRLGEQARTWA